MSFVSGLRCVLCNTLHSNRVPYTCPACGLPGILDVEYDYGAIGRVLTKARLARRLEGSQWRYRELLPLTEGSVLPPVPVGWSPLLAAGALARNIGVRTLYLKDDGRNPSGSLKDRASALAVVRARERRQKVIACASTGNAASSCAGMAAAMGLRSVIFVPDRVPEPKLTQLLVFGATVLRVRGSYDNAWRLCQQTCQKRGWYNRNCAVNPYLLEGKKTVGFEICEQLDWKVPDWVAVSVGDGCSLAGVWKGFREMKALGLIEKTPRILGVQAAGAAPVTAAFFSGEPVQPLETHTFADSIAVGVPRNWRKAVGAVKESRGTMVNVSDDEIMDAIRYTGHLAGVFAEPAAAAAVAGLRRAVEDGTIGSHATTLAVITGNGLKDIRGAHAAVGNPFDVPADGDGIESILREQNLAA